MRDMDSLILIIFVLLFDGVKSPKCRAVQKRSVILYPYIHFYKKSFTVSVHLLTLLNYLSILTMQVPAALEEADEAP